jgi:hypothetical protein
LGEGRFHLTNQAANLPQIFTQETTSIQRTYLVEERFFPNLSDSAFARNHAIFRAMERAGITRVPPLLGYVGTSPKDTAQMILETHLGDPLLAAWEYGLGRSVAWTSDATSRWALDWVRWNGFPTFWSNLVRWSITQGRDSVIETDVTLEDEKAQLTVDARGADGRYLNDMDMEAAIVYPDGRATTLNLVQTAPGHYAGEFGLNKEDGSAFEPLVEGAYFIRVVGSTDEGTEMVGQTSGWVLGYSPEYRELEADPALLNQMAELTNGRILALTTGTDSDNQADLESGPEAIFEHNLEGGRAVRPIWPWLLGLAAFLLPLDVAVRRLIITKKDVSQALNKVWAGTIGRWQPQTEAQDGRDEQVERLFQAKKRARKDEQDEKSLSSEMVTSDISKAESERPADQADSSHWGEEADTTQDAPSEEGTLASRLLERRRQRNQDERE